MRTIQLLDRLEAVTGLDIVRSSKNIGTVCEACAAGKATQASHSRKEKSSCSVLELLHTDIIWPIKPSGTAYRG